MPYRILESTVLAPQVTKLIVEAPHVPRNWKPGQFVIVRVDQHGERIPLTIAFADPHAGTVELYVQAVGATTTDLAGKRTGDSIADIVGPLGKATHVENVGHAVVVGGGVGTAVIYPQARALAMAGNRVSAVIGGRTKNLVLLENELRELCDAVYPCTDDGSYGFHGLVTNQLKYLLDNSDIPIRMVLCAGPVPMMQAVAEVTRPYGVHTVASLNPIMVDGTGMCGGCRVQVGGKTQFACVDGPEFDAHLVDFSELSNRLRAYRDQERDSLHRHICQLSTQGGVHSS